MGKTYAHYGRPRSIARLFRQIDALTAADVQAVACEVYAPERLTTLVYGA